VLPCSIFPAAKMPGIHIHYNFRTIWIARRRNKRSASRRSVSNISPKPLYRDIAKLSGIVSLARVWVMTNAANRGRGRLKRLTGLM
jgi:hypothetical protein